MRSGSDRRQDLPLRRRDFLSLLAMAPLVPLAASVERRAGATGLIAAAADGAAAESPAVAGAAAAARALPLSIGYIEGSEELSNLAKLPLDLQQLTVVRRGATFTAERRSLPAPSYPAGDPSLVGGPVRLTVHDLYPHLLPQDPALAARWPVAVDLDILSPMPGAPGSNARFAAWSYRRLPAEDRSARVSLLTWPDWYSDLMLQVRVVPAGDAPTPQTYTASFTLGADPGRPRLLKGIYLLGLTADAWEGAVELPDDPAAVPPERLSVLITVEPVGVRVGRG